MLPARRRTRTERIRERFILVSWDGQWAKLGNCDVISKEVLVTDVSQFHLATPTTLLCLQCCAAVGRHWQHTVVSFTRGERFFLLWSSWGIPDAAFDVIHFDGINKSIVACAQFCSWHRVAIFGLTPCRITELLKHQWGHGHLLASQPVKTKCSEVLCLFFLLQKPHQMQCVVWENIINTRVMSCFFKLDLYFLTGPKDKELDYTPKDANMASCGHHWTTEADPASQRFAF